MTENNATALMAILDEEEAILATAQHEMEERRKELETAQARVAALRQAVRAKNRVAGRRPFWRREVT